jgi:N-acetylglucosamine-6-sulfatase
MTGSVRRVAASLGLALALNGGWGIAATPARSVGPSRPDIIVIVTDDQRPGTLHWTPTLHDHFVNRGIRFPRAMVPTSLCCPSRASLLTGEYAHTTRVWSNAAGWTRFVSAGMESKTVAVWLRQSGYRTGLVGKYLNHFTGTSPPPGWRAWHSFIGNNGRYYDYKLLHTNGSVTSYGSAPASYSTDVLRRLAMRFIDATPTDRPFFLYFAPFAPHEPATPAPRHLSLAAPISPFDPPSFNEKDLSDKPPWIQRLKPVSFSNVQKFRVQQYRTLRSVDDAFSAMLDAQRTRRRLANTLIVFIGDNGVMWGEHRVLGKFVPYRGATRIPLAMAWPAGLPEGRVDGRLALNIDVPVTIAAAAGATHDDVAGRDLLQGWDRTGFLLEAGASRFPGGNGTNVERPAYCGWRTARYLFVHYGNGREELYDYALDPWELRDRRGTRPELQARLRRHAREACQPVPPGFSWK